MVDAVSALIIRVMWLHSFAYSYLDRVNLKYSTASNEILCKLQFHMHGKVVILCVCFEIIKKMFLAYNVFMSTDDKFRDSDF